MPTDLVATLSVVLLMSRDTARTAAFYRDVLGLTLRAEEHDGKHQHFAGQLGSIYFTIQAASDLSAPAPDQGYDFLQLCFTTPDLDAFLQRLPEFNVTPLHPPRPFEETTFTTLLDPDGRHVRVMTPWGKSSS